MPRRFPHRGERVQPGVTPAAGAAAGAAPRAAAPSRAGIVTRPSGSTIVRPPGSANDPWRNQAGEPPAAGPCVGAAVWEIAGVLKRAMPIAIAATPTRCDVFMRPALRKMIRVPGDVTPRLYQR